MQTRREHGAANSAPPANSATSQHFAQSFAAARALQAISVQWALKVPPRDRAVVLRNTALRGRASPPLLLPASSRGVATVSTCARSNASVCLASTASKGGRYPAPGGASAIPAQARLLPVAVQRGSAPRNPRSRRRWQWAATHCLSPGTSTTAQAARRARPVMPAPVDSACHALKASSRMRPVRPSASHVRQDAQETARWRRQPRPVRVSARWATCAPLALAARPPAHPPRSAPKGPRGRGL